MSLNKDNIEESIRLAREALDAVSPPTVSRFIVVPRRFYQLFSFIDKVKIMWSKPTLTEKMEELFYHVLCPYPDQTRLGMWWYGVSGRISGYFYRKHCRRCNAK